MNPPWPSWGTVPGTKKGRRSRRSDGFDLYMAFEDWEKQGERVYYFLTSITDIHLDSHVISEFEQNGDRSYLYMLFCIACFILLLACLNFINLTTARASNRAKEVGIRKTIGAIQKKLITQFMASHVFTPVLRYYLVSHLLHSFFHRLMN